MRLMEDLVGMYTTLIQVIIKKDDCLHTQLPSLWKKSKGRDNTDSTVVGYVHPFTQLSQPEKHTLEDQDTPSRFALRQKNWGDACHF